MKQKANIALGLKKDSHKHDFVNFFWPKVNATSSGFIGSNVDASKSSGIVRDEAFVLTFQGLKVQEYVCGDGVYVENWKVPTIIKHSLFCIQKYLMKHCDTRIITRRTICGIPNPCYDGLQSNLKGSALICHKFWFCVNDLTCAGRIERKYCVDRPLVPSTWLMQVRTNLI
jgi:hypothetical protein